LPEAPPAPGTEPLPGAALARSLFYGSRLIVTHDLLTRAGGSITFVRTDGGLLRYIRFQVTYSGKLGYPVGIFGACHHLRRAGVLSPEEDKLFAEVDAWFEREMPSPPFYADGNTRKAITWFRSTSSTLVSALAPLKALLDRHNVECRIVETDDPGTIFYEDDYQVGVVDPKFPPVK